MTTSEPSTHGEPPEQDWAWIQRPVISLSHPHFRLFWFSNLIVAVGIMVAFTARGWLIVQLTDSALLLGVVEGAWALAAGLGSIPMGVLADRTNRRDLLLLGNGVALMLALTIGLLVVADRIAVWHVMVVAGIDGVLFAARFPAGQSMTARLVPEEHVMNAISLNTASHSLPNVAGPAAGGILVAGLGIAAAYFTTSGAMLLALLLMFGVSASFGRIERAPGASVVADLREGYDYVRRHGDLLRLTLAMMTPYILGQSYVLLLPLFVRSELDAGPETFGALSACLGAGSVIGATLVATFGKLRQIGILMFLGIVVIGVFAIVYGLSHWVVLTALALFFAGAGESALFSAYETLLLVRLPDEMRGRVMGLLFTVIGLFPLSAVAAGAVADVIGLRTLAVVEGGVIIVVASFAWRTVFRHATTTDAVT